MHVYYNIKNISATVSDSPRKNMSTVFVLPFRFISSHKSIGRIMSVLLFMVLVMTFCLHEGAYAKVDASPASDTSAVDIQTVNLRGYVSKAKLVSGKTGLHKKKHVVKLFWEKTGSLQPTHYSIYLRSSKKGGYAKVKDVTVEHAKIKVSVNSCRIRVVPYYQTQEGSCMNSIYLMTKRRNARKVKVTGIKRTLLTGHSLKIRARQNGNVSSSIKWRVSDSRIARIRRGKLIGVKSGSVELTARAHSGVTKKLRITVISKYPDSISFDGSVPTELYESESATLNPVISDALNKSLKWSTSSKSVAKINSKGKITALKAGTVTIKAAARGPYYKKKFARARTKITVYPLYPKSVSIVNPSSSKLNKGNVLTMQASTDKAKYTGLTWKSSKKSVASIDKNTGLLTAIKPGTTTITVTAPGKNKHSLPTSTIGITVQPEVEGMVLWAEKIALNNEFGYSMNLTKYSTWKSSNLNRHCYFCDKTNSKDYDCASFVAAAITHGNVGFGNLCKKTGGCSSLYNILIKKGWKDIGKIKPEAMQRGDIMINPASHVEIFTGKQNKLGEYLNVGAHDDYDGISGDPSGKEISIAPITWFKGSYTTVLRFSK